MGHEVLLKGLPADNPLGFLAALGTLVTVTRAWPRVDERNGVRLGWRPVMGGWRPELRLPRPLPQEDLADLLQGALRKAVNPDAQAAAAKALTRRNAASSAFRGAQKRLKALGRRASTEDRAEVLTREVEPAWQSLQVATQEYRSALADGGAPDPSVSLGAALKQVAGEAFAEAASEWAKEAQPKTRRLVDLAAAFGCEVVLDDEGNLAPTQFSKHNGAGGRSMLADIGKLMVQIEPDRIAASLFRPWDYGDEKLGAGWDPADARAHAHMGENPERAGSVTMHGATLLAFEGLVLFPTVPNGRHLTTTGTSVIAGVREFTWPIWNAYLGVDAVRSIVSLEDIQVAVPDRERLSRIGIVDVFRAEHFTFGKYPRFRPSRSV